MDDQIIIDIQYPDWVTDAFSEKEESSQKENDQFETVTQKSKQRGLLLLGGILLISFTLNQR